MLSLSYLEKLLLDILVIFLQICYLTEAPYQLCFICPGSQFHRGFGGRLDKCFPNYSAVPDFTIKFCILKEDLMVSAF